MVGITKPNGSTVTTVYDDMQRVTSTVEKTAGGVVITGFEYTYDDLSRIVEEKHLDKNWKLCYTYDSLNRVIKRTVKNLSNAVLSEETYSYDAAGNMTDAPDSCFAYDTNNRLTTFNCNCVSYDADGNMRNNGALSFNYDSANRLTSAGGHTYTYNAEDVRIKNLCSDATTTYTYDTNCKLSRMLQKTTNGITTKYVYGLGLIGEEKQGCFKTYHFDCRGSTVAITDANGNITDTFAYDTYGNLTSRTGTSFVIFGYNGRDGVVTDKNGLIYMRARYYLPEMRRFINADIIPGKISNAVTLNRFAYANGNPVSFVDPFGLSVWSWIKDKYNDTKDWVADTYNDAKDAVVDTYNAAKDVVVETYNDAKQAIVDTYNEVTDWAVDTYNDVKERVVNTYNDAKDFVVDKYNDAKDWVDEKIVQPIVYDFNGLVDDLKNYDKKNKDVDKVLKARHFSSYEGKFVLKTAGEYGFSIGAIFVGRTNLSENDVKHEYGHTVQLDNMGLLDYITDVAIPSVTAYNLDKHGKLPYDYYTAPWEAEADVHGSVSRARDKNYPAWTPSDGYYDFWDLVKAILNI